MTSDDLHLCHISPSLIPTYSDSSRASFSDSNPIKVGIRPHPGILSFGSPWHAAGVSPSSLIGGWYTEKSASAFPLPMGGLVLLLGNLLPVDPLGLPALCPTIGQSFHAPANAECYISGFWKHDFNHFFMFWGQSRVFVLFEICCRFTF